MKILAVTPLYPPKPRGGAWIATHQCLRFMVGRGHDVDVIVSMGGGQPYVLDGVKVWPRAIRSEGPMRNCDVVVSHLGDRNRGAMLAKRFHKPSVRFAHGGMDETSFTRLAQDGGTALLVCNAEATRVALDWLGPTIVVHPPVDPAEYATTPGDRITLVNLADQKGGGLFWRLAEQMPDMSFLGVPGGWGAQTRGHLPNVQVIPHTENMRRDVYARTRILLIPSLDETWGMVGVEAMASGIPVIAHPTPGLRECLSYAGIYADRLNLDQWEAAIRALSDPTLWQRASKMASRRSADLDTTDDLERFAVNVEALGARKAMPCAS